MSDLRRNHPATKHQGVIMMICTQVEEVLKRMRRQRAVRPTGGQTAAIAFKMPVCLLQPSEVIASHGSLPSDRRGKVSDEGVARIWGD